MPPLSFPVWIALALTLSFWITPTAYGQLDHLRKVERQTKALFHAGEFAKLEDLKKNVHAKPEDVRNPLPLIDTFYQALEVDSKAPEQRFLEQKQLLDQWEKEDPDSITRKTVLIRWWTTYAQTAQGTTPTRQGPHPQTRLAQDRLNEALKVHRTVNLMMVDDPMYFRALYIVARELGQHKFAEELFIKGAGLNPENLPLYRTHAHYLLLKLHRQEGAYEKEAARIADNIGGDKGDALYAELITVKFQNHDLNTAHSLKKTTSDYHRVKRGMTAVKNRAFTAIDVIVAQRLAYISSVMGDMETTRKTLLIAHGDQPETYFPTQTLYQEAFERSGAKQFLNEINVLEQRGEFNEIENRLRNIDTSFPGNHSLLFDFFLRNGLEDQYIALTHGHFHTTADPRTGTLDQIYYVGLLNILFGKYEVSKQAAERFDQARPQNLGGKVSLLFNALIDDDEEKIASIFKSTLEYKSDRLGYQMVQAILRGEKTAPDAIDFILAQTDPHDSQTGLFLIGYYLHKKDGQTVRRLIEVFDMSQNATHSHRSFAKSLLQGKLQPLLVKAETGQ